MISLSGDVFVGLIDLLLLQFYDTKQKIKLIYLQMQRENFCNKQ
jgi:hypothetical protein